MKKKITTKIIDGVLYDEFDDPVFTKEMKKDYKILIPSMLPIHFELIKKMLSSFGYNAEVLNFTDSHLVSETGLKYVHNDTCYPATLVIGEFIEAITSGNYDTKKIALVITQTGGGCRASNYLFLLKKALKKAGYGYIPVLSLNFSGLRSQPGFKFSFSEILDLLKCVLYGDLLMLLKNQCLPYEKNNGETETLTSKWIDKLLREFGNRKKLSFKNVKKNYNLIISDFEKIEKVEKTIPKVGIVGEIFVKFSPLGNNRLEEFLNSEGAEVYVPGLLDFIMYFVVNNINDTKLYGIGKKTAFLYRIVYKFMLKKQKEIINAVSKSKFNPPSYFKETEKLKNGYIGEGMKMGEGWLLTAEMIELIQRGIYNIVCTQPFGCLPNHIAGKGMLKLIREKNPSANIVAIDYDASASKVNQENRIKLMLENARQNLEKMEETL